MNKQAYEHIVGLSLDKTAARGGLRRLSKLVKPVGTWMGKAYDSVFPVDEALGRKSRQALNAPVRWASLEARDKLAQDALAERKLREFTKRNIPEKYRPPIHRDNNRLRNAPIQESARALDSMVYYAKKVNNNPREFSTYDRNLSEAFYKRIPSAYEQMAARYRVGAEFYKRPLVKAWHNYIKPTLVTGGIGAGIYGLCRYVYDKFTDPQYTE